MNAARRFIFRAAILTVLIVAIGVGAGAGDPTDVKAPPLDNLSWLAGRWQGEAFGGVIEEVWDRPWGGSLIGTFKLVVDGTVSFYEFMTITADSAGPVLRVKHFNADLSGWEAKEEAVVFPVVDIGERAIRFDGISYRLMSPESLQIKVNLGHSEGASEEVTINCVRTDD